MPKRGADEVLGMAVLGGGMSVRLFGTRETCCKPRITGDHLGLLNGGNRRGRRNSGQRLSCVDC